MSPTNSTAIAKRLATLVVLLSLVQNGSSRKRDYRGFSVLRGLPQTQEQLSHLQSLMTENLNDGDNELQFWTEPFALNGTVDIMVSPFKRPELEDELSKWNIPTEELMADVGQAIRRTRTSDDFGPGNITWRQMLDSDRYYSQFQRYAAIEAKIRQLEQLDPRIVVDIIGKSSERRNIYLVKVSNDPNAGKPIILIDGGHHAREWISHSTVMYLLESLVNTDVPRMPPSSCRTERCRLETLRNRAKLDLNKYDFWFIPVVNPDGYEYSHTADRLWRKTRSGSFCRGTDPNRNYPFHWNESGSSSYMCSEVYAGPRARSEPELLLAPYGYARVYPNNYNELARVANSWLEAMNRLRGTEYQFGTSAITLYPSSGGSDDYAHSIGIPLAYTVELPDKGRNGFITPPSEIIPIAHETLIGVQSMVDSIVPSARAFGRPRGHNGLLATQ